MRLPRLVTVVVAVLATLGLGAGAAHAAVWESSERFGTWTDGDYIVRNNIWGSGAGSQTIWANAHDDWGVRADHPNTGGVKSYPHVGKSVNESVGAIDDMTSEFDVTVPDAGAYATAYDLWVDNHDYEIMIWMNQHGPVGPIGGRVATVDVGGHQWNVHKGSNGSNEVFSFVRTSDTTAATVDIKAVLDWIVQRGWFSSDVTVGEVQFGFEITSASGGLDFVTSRYSMTAS